MPNREMMLSDLTNANQIVLQCFEQPRLARCAKENSTHPRPHPPAAVKELPPSDDESSTPSLKVRFWEMFLSIPPRLVLTEMQ